MAIARIKNERNPLAAYPDAVELVQQIHDQGMAVVPVGVLDAMVGQVEGLMRALEICGRHLANTGGDEAEELTALCRRALEAVG